VSDGDRIPCAVCGYVSASRLHTGEARVLIGMTAPELEELVFATSNVLVRERMLSAIGLLDQHHEQTLRKEIVT
jgi:hypothetical protein